jgi:hypothetical protein
MSGGMGALLTAGEPVRIGSDTGAIVIDVEAPRLVATSRGTGPRPSESGVNGSRAILLLSHPLKRLLDHWRSVGATAP